MDPWVTEKSMWSCTSRTGQKSPPNRWGNLFTGRCPTRESLHYKITQGGYWGSCWLWMVLIAVQWGARLGRSCPHCRSWTLGKLCIAGACNWKSCACLRTRPWRRCHAARGGWMLEKQHTLQKPAQKVPEPRNKPFAVSLQHPMLTKLTTSWLRNIYIGSKSISMNWIWRTNSALRGN